MQRSDGCLSQRCRSGPSPTRRRRSPVSTLKHLPTDEETHPDSAEDGAQAGRAPAPADPLARHPRISAGLLGALAVGVLVASLLGEDERGLPTVALGWRLGLVLIRAAVAFAIVAVVVLLIVRGWSGLWPQRVSRDGLDYPDASTDASRQTTSPPAHCPPPPNERQSSPWRTPTA